MSLVQNISESFINETSIVVYRRSHQVLHELWHPVHCGRSRNV